ncbi:MAG: MBL fold metallo-hydrolase [Gammaproteobacteria bacterium]|nr:MBL fold metallo-hydrolase [Gammaproteobacteria bacterium]
MYPSKYAIFATTVVGALLINSAVLAGVGHTTSDHGHVPGPEVAIANQPVGGNVSAITGVGGFAGGNVGVLSGADGVLIVDSLLSGFQYKLENVLSTLKVCSGCGDVKYLINTHWHFDHTGTNEYFGNDAVLIAHNSVRPLLSSEQEVKAVGKVFPALKPSGLPDITFTEQSSLYFNGEEIELTHFPKSHTSGDVVVYFKQSEVLHLGDLYFNGMFPFVDLEHGGNVLGMIRSVESVLQSYPADTKVIPGHGAVSGMEELRSFLMMLKETTAIVEKGKNSGMSLQLMQKQGLDEKWASWEWGFVSTKIWITLVYNSLP